MSTPTISLSGPADVAVSVPYLLGYRPAQSVVVMCLNGRGVACTARVDADYLLSLREEVVTEVNNSVIAQIARKEPVTQVILLGYDTEGIAALRALKGYGGVSVDVRDYIAVDESTWTSLCDDTDCHLIHTGPLVDERGATAEFVAMGIAPLSDRDALVALHKPSPVDLPEPLPDLTDDELMQSWLTILDGTWSPLDLANVSSRPLDPTARDTVHVWLGAGPPSMLDEIEDPSWHERFDRMPTVERGIVIASLFAAAKAANNGLLWATYATAVWSDGDGAKALIAIDYGKQAEPEYRLLLLLEGLILRGIKFPQGSPQWVS